MRKAFSTLVGLLLLAGAALHAYRILHPFTIIVGSHNIPVTYSYVGVVIAAILGIMVLVETRR